MWTTTAVARRFPAAAGHGTTAPAERAAQAGCEDLPTVRALGQELVAVILLRARRHARWWRTAVRAMTTARADAWRCAAQLVLVLVTSSSLAWLSWQGTAEQRRPDAAPARTGVEGRLEGRLEGSLRETDLTRELEVRRGAAGGTTKSTAKSNRNATAKAGGPSSPVGGWVLSITAVSVVLAAGAGVAALVVRRHRRRPGAPQEPLLLAPERLLADPVDDDALDEEQDDALDGEQDDALDEDQAPAPHADDTSTRDRSTDVDDGPRTRDLAGLDDVSALGGGAVDLGGSATVPGQHVDVVPPGPSTAVRLVAGTESGSTLLVGSTGPRVETRERLFERRAAPRVEYVQPGTMSWRGASWQLTVRDLSGAGVRVRIPDPQGCRLPATRDNVQVDFPVDGGRVRVSARVAWRKPTPEGTEFGLLFATLPADDQDLIGRTCEARS